MHKINITRLRTLMWNAEMLMGVIDAAEEANSPVIISFGTGFVGNTSFEDFSHMMVSMAKKPLCR